MGSFFSDWRTKIVINSGIPNAMFYKMTGIAVAITMGFGAFFFIKLSPKWEKTFESNEELNNS